jgi:hypothetical protein
MKNQVFKPIALFLALSLAFTITNARPDSEQRKEINKTYQVSPATSLSFTNSFGRLHINTWDKNEVQVNIEIITRASSESKAKDMLGRININIDDSNPASAISFKTSLSNRNNSGNQSFEINYNVSIPVNNPLYMKNSFGDAYLGDFKGSLTLDESYGNLKAEHLEGASKIDLSFGGGTSTIGSIRQGSLKVGYSNLDVGLIGQLEVNTQFSNIKIEKAMDVSLSAKYGEVKFGEVNSMDANVNFASFKIDQLEKKLVLDIEYGGNTSIGEVSKNIQNLQVESSFGPVKLDLPADLNASIKVKVEFGNLDYDGGKINFNRIHEGQTSKEYEGKIGNGSSTVNIILNSKYGDIKLNEN